MILEVDIEVGIVGEEVHYGEVLGHFIAGPQVQSDLLVQKTSIVQKLVPFTVETDEISQLLNEKKNEINECETKYEKQVPIWERIEKEVMNVVDRLNFFSL